MTGLRLNTEHVIMMHSEIVRASGGGNGIRDMGLLESAVNAPFQSFGGCDVYPDIYRKAACLGYNLARNHAFIDGNKRIAALSVFVFLRANGVNLSCTEWELFTLFYGLAASEVTFDDLVSWLKSHDSPRD
ncbi:MAG: type II toxin-antitoxin system death-on-curing family toxin [Synergistaceae bacterium]|nr:type II toxin-antitoxin system death-on-curing family toxin [Synergistaceae bacterium]MBQ7169771.1 type II toxin-antitoxin system death-on-curing family toxin [Synergistaceae bacterium]